MRKLLRRAMIVVLVLGIAVALMAFVGYRRMHGTPTWYRTTPEPDQQQLADAADRLQHKVESAHSWAAIEQNQQQHPQVVISQNLLGPTTRPGILDPLELTVSEEEINAFFQRWDAEYHWTQEAAAYVSNPQVAIREASFIIAATVPEIQAVVSLHFQPAIENGLLRLKLAKVMAGMLPLPQSVWTGYRDKLLSELLGKLPPLQQAADLKADGSANDQMVQAVLIKLLIHVVRDEAADPVLFLPYMQAYREHSLPVKLTGARIDDAAHSLMLRFEPLTHADRDALIASVHALPAPKADSD